MKKIETIHDRVSQIIDCFGDGKNTVFAKHIGESEANIRGYKANVIPKQPFLEKVVRCLDVSPDWLLTGRGPMRRSETTTSQNVFYTQEPLSSIIEEPGSSPPQNQEKAMKALQSDQGIPLIPLDAIAGFGTGNGAQVMEYECEKYVIPNFRGAEFLIQVKGSSMYPKYSSGDIVACKKLRLDTFFQWNKVYVIDTEQGVLIKRVAPGCDTDHVLLVSENTKYTPFEIHREEIYSLAIVIGVIRLE